MVAYREGYLDIQWSALDVYDNVAKELKTDIENQEWFTGWTEIDFDSEDFKEKLDEVFDSELNTEEGYFDTWAKCSDTIINLHFCNWNENDFEWLGRLPQSLSELAIGALNYAWWSKSMMGRIYICDKIKELALGKEED